MMTDVSADAERNDAHEEPDWPLRPWLLAGVLGFAGLLIHFASDGSEDTGWRIALAALLFFAPVSAALSVERDDWRVPLAFSIVLGLVMAGLAWRAVQYGDYLPDEQYGFGAGVLASLLALPLFQAGFLKRRFATPYADVHYHVWNDALAGAGAIAFTGLSWLVLLVLSELFHLLKIDLIRDLMNEEWFGWTFSGTAFGAGLGTLKNQARVLGTLQSVAMLVLGLLAVPFAFGLVLFLGATILSGPDVLWEATRSATPVLLLCTAGAFVLANAVLRNGDGEMTGNRAMRAAAWLLAAVILPLAIFAAVSMGQRLAQYGLAPERLWGLVAIAVACAFGLGYWVALLRGRRAHWAPTLRQTNLRLAAGVCVLAILLALPILDFASIATRNQLARLESGAVSADNFDYAALRWDFGEPGKRALARLAQTGPGKAKTFAAAASAQTERPYGRPNEDAASQSERLARLRIETDDPGLQAIIEAWLQREAWRCDARCVAIDIGPRAPGVRRFVFVEGTSVEVMKVDARGEVANAPMLSYVPDAEPPSADAVVEVRPWSGRRVHVDGRPVGEPFE
jgi:hypothetical protein